MAAAPAFVDGKPVKLDRAALLKELKRLGGEARLARPDRVAATGIAALDQALGGGLPKGRLTEIVGRRSSGRTALAVATLAAAAARGEVVALIDVEGAFDARRAEAAGLDLDRLLWVHAGDAGRGLRAADLALRAGGFGVLILDVGDVTPRAPDAAWLRLARAAEHAGAAVAVVAPWPAARAFAALTVETSRARLRVDGGVGAPSLVRAVESTAAVVRSKLGARPDDVRLSLRLR